MSISKEEVNNLKNVKFITGNGFDRHCGLDTSYSQYFKDLLKRKEKVLEFVSNFDFRSSNNFHEYDTFAEEINAWDLYFYLIRDDADKRWFEIETIIADSIKEDDSSNDYTHPKWNYVFSFSNCFINTAPDYYPLPYNRYVQTNYSEFAEKYKDIVSKLAFFCFRKKGKKVDYKWLFSELNKFEIEFGQYIEKQHTDKADEYKNKLAEFKKYVFPNSNVVSVDTFNYGNFNDEEFDNMLSFVNGNTKEPIFGIDSDIFKQSQPQSIFSKTNRRTALKIPGNGSIKKHKFENAIIYGHSIDEADFSYFIPLLDELEMMDKESDSKIVFSYSPHGKSTEENDANLADLKKNIAILFDKYFEDSRRYDQLALEQRVCFFEVPKSR